MLNNIDQGIKVSVIVPVYNGEKYLRQCMDSICNQTLREIEIICVDDGSTDSSYEILKEYQDHDPRVQIYQQPNLYAGTARNLGMQHATGEYLVFWDCDDYFELSALEDLYDRASSLQADICVCGANRYFNDTDKLEPNVVYYLNTKIITDKDVFNRRTNEDYILNFTTPVPWNKLFRRAFIEQYGIKFQNVQYSNDISFTVHALCQAEIITTINKALINYRMNINSSLTVYSRKSPALPINAWATIAESLKRLEIFPERSFVNRAIANLIYLLRNLQTFDVFEEAVHYLQDGALEKMSITDDHEADYYYVPWHKDVVDLLYHDKPEELETYLAYYSFSHMMQYSTDKRLANISLSQTRASLAKAKALNSELKIKLKLQREKKAVKQERISNYKRRLDKSKTKIKQKNKEIKKYKKELETIQNSYSYRIGRWITYLPRKIRKFFH